MNFPIILIEGEQARTAFMGSSLEKLGYGVLVGPYSSVQHYDTLDYIKTVMSAVKLAEKSPIAILGLWRARAAQDFSQLLSGESVVRLPLPRTTGRVLERVMNRYGVQRVLIENERVSWMQSTFAKLPDGTWFDYFRTANLRTSPYWSVLPSYDRDDMMKVTERAALRQRYLPPSALSDNHSWYGVNNPDVIVVGDSFLPRWRLLQLPFPFAKDDHSALFFSRALDLAEVREDHLAYVNVNDHGGEEYLRQVLNLDSESLIVRPRVVALGGRAAKTLLNLGVSYHLIDHPQYARRFAHHHIENYAAELADLLARR